MLMKTPQVVRVVETFASSAISWVALNFLGSVFVFAIRKLCNSPQNCDCFVITLQFGDVRLPIQILIKFMSLQKLALNICMISVCALCGAEGKLTIWTSGNAYEM